MGFYSSPGGEGFHQVIVGIGGAPTQQVTSRLVYTAILGHPR